MKTETPVLELVKPEPSTKAATKTATKAVNDALFPKQVPAPTVFTQPYDIPPNVDAMLATILQWPRSHGSISEAGFQSWLTDYLKASLLQQVKIHSAGAVSVTVPRADGKFSAVLFSCHIDTVDDDCGMGIVKNLVYDANLGHILMAAEQPAKAITCLGADDGAGVWLMLKMIEAKKPGTYLFHRGEECGGISAKAIAKSEKEWLRTFDIALAFDRPNDYEVITHQGGSRCASDKAADALCNALNDHGMMYIPSDHGVYTDTKEYRRDIAECFNLGVGYNSQHGRKEVLDYAFLCALLEASLKVDWDFIPVDRVPVLDAHDPDDDYMFPSAYGYGRGFGGHNLDTDTGWEFDDDDKAWRKKTKGGKKADSKDKLPDPVQKAVDGVTPSYTDSLVRWARTASIDELFELIEVDSGEGVSIITGLLADSAALTARVEYLEQLVEFARASRSWEH